MSHPVDENKRLFREKKTKQQKLALQSGCAVAVCSWSWKHLSPLAPGAQSRGAAGWITPARLYAWPHAVPGGRLPPLAQGGCVSEEKQFARMKILSARG